MNFHLPYLPNTQRGTKFLLMAVLWILFQGAFAQKTDRKKLEQQRNNTRKQIETTRKILKQTQGQKQKSVAVLRTLQAQIGLRKRIVNQISTELVGIDGEISTQNEEIKALSKEIVLLKTQYASLIYNGYKANNSRNRLQFVFSADDFNQVIKRMNYLKKLVEFRKKQLTLIKAKIEENTHKINQLLETKSEKLLLLNNREKEKIELETDETEANNLLNELKKQEKELIKDLREKEELARKLDDAIKKAIEAEIKRAKAEEEQKRKAEAERKRKEAEAKAKENKTTTAPTATKAAESNFSEFNTEDIALSKQFNLNKSKLPWPVGGGFISQAFGIHPHPTMRNITTENNGINISTTQGTNARVIFDGEVTAIVKIPGTYNTVLVKHGEFFTVYSNLEEVYVSKGKTLKTGAELGKIHTNEEGKTELHFEVWKGNEKQNPELWLRRK